jgi:hypothetical protein
MVRIRGVAPAFAKATAGGTLGKSLYLRGVAQLPPKADQPLAGAMARPDLVGRSSLIFVLFGV